MKMPAARKSAAGILDGAAPLLRYGFDHVADFEFSAGDGGTDGGCVVDVGGFDDADVCSEAANDGTCGWVLDLLADAHDLKLVTNFDAGSCADVEDDLTAIDRGNQSLDGDGADGNLGGVCDQVGGELVDGDLGGFTNDGVLEVAAAEVGIAGAKAVPVAAAAGHGGT